ncbi:arabinogalactan endo-1,4-beta-galactosidase [Lindgomyces ingoldianus]|uniref:Arabinogalactan endo-1,4-beta-galactosidase n=1 Tax=Lindgomyces ingoldianus TaxID=673940 RepID=A0ACB6QWN4_9PLEO|nr:arabinogalactan endo-1,4-beta-galactosidase [Lindgomyces ingoldianus]KAF2470697.1 arabinogalactan endo-1,4-beta-galactosidase [Lindgomyces ingoldianus]
MKPLTRLGNATLRRPFRAVANPARFTSRGRGVSRPSVAPRAAFRAFHASVRFSGIMPDAENPAPKESEPSERITAPTDITTSEYNQRADEYLDELVSRLEAEQEKRQDLEVEYSAGVLEVSIQSKGTYVLNKQPPNKQIWLSSPLSGPKRFDWVVTGESMNEKEGSGMGDWVYLRDGTSLTELVRKELGVQLGVDGDVPS